MVPGKDNPSNDQEKALLVNGSEDLEAFSSSSSVEENGGGDDKERLTSRAINASIVLGFGTLAVSRLLTIDHDYWHVSDVCALSSVLCGTFGLCY